jgi:iron complex transport system substrate-binding protein
MRKLLAMSIVSLLCVSLAITSGLAAEYTLKVFGNANMDEVVDEADIEYVQGIIEGTHEVTELADANYDGEIDEEDITQIEQIIAGEETELILIDNANRIVTVSKPIERIVTLFPSITRVILALDGCDRLVGVDSTTTSGKYANRMIMLQAYPELLELPDTGLHNDPNPEQVLSLKPNVIFGYSDRDEWCSPIQEKTGIPVVGIYTDPNLASSCFETYRLVGKVIGKEERAEELIEFSKEKFEELRDVTSQIPDDEKPRVHLAFWSSITSSPGSYYPVDLAGGSNVISSESSVTVSKEQIIAWNPDVILIHGPSAPHSLSVEDVLSDPDLLTVNAVKNKRVYYTKGHFIGWDPATGLVEAYYMAKLFHPDKFKDLDVEAEGNSILEKFYGVDGLYTWILENSDLYRWES